MLGATNPPPRNASNHHTGNSGIRMAGMVARCSFLLAINGIIKLYVIDERTNEKRNELYMYAVTLNQ